VEVIRGLLVAAGIGTVGIPAVAVLAAFATVGGTCVAAGGLRLKRRSQLSRASGSRPPWPPAPSYPKPGSQP